MSDGAKRRHLLGRSSSILVQRMRHLPAVQKSLSWRLASFSA